MGHSLSFSLNYYIIYAMMPLRQHLGLQYVSTVAPYGNALVLIRYLYISQSLIILINHHYVLDRSRLKQILQELVYIFAVFYNLDLFANRFLNTVDVASLAAYGCTHIAFFDYEDYAVVFVIHDTVSGHAARKALK